MMEMLLLFTELDVDSCKYEVRSRYRVTGLKWLASVDRSSRDLAGHQLPEVVGFPPEEAYILRTRTLRIIFSYLRGRDPCQVSSQQRWKPSSFPPTLIGYLPPSTGSLTHYSFGVLPSADAPLPGLGSLFSNWGPPSHYQAAVGVARGATMGPYSYIPPRHRLGFASRRS